MEAWREGNQLKETGITSYLLVYILIFEMSVGFDC